MGKKKSCQIQSPMKISKHERRQELNSLIKTLRPKVYITDTSNFKTLVQQLTGKGNYSPLSSPPLSTSLSQSPPSFVARSADQDHAYDQENSLRDLLSFDSYSCFSSTPLEGSSPDLSLPESLNQNMDFSSRCKDLESMLMEMESGPYDYESWYNGMFQQEVCVYDCHHYHDLSSYLDMN